MALSLPRHTTWSDPVWLSQNGGVRPENAIEYFSRSMFCTHGEGAEFHLEGVLPHPSGRQAIVIKRRKRRSEHVSDVQAVYYILDGTIFQCPGILELVTSRLSKCAYHLEKGFDDIRAQCERQQLQKFKDDFNLGDDADTPLPTSEDQQQQQQQGVGGLEPLDAPMEL